MLAGGRLTGTDETGKDMEFGVANYDYLYPDARVPTTAPHRLRHRDHRPLGHVSGSKLLCLRLHVTTIGSFYPRAPKPYGLEYVLHLG